MPRLTAILLESHLAGPLRSAARQAGVELDLFFLHNLNAGELRRSIREATAVFGGVLTLDESVAHVAAMVNEERPPVVAFFHSQAEALQLNRIGDFDAQSGSWREALHALRKAGIALPGLLNVFLAALPQVASALPNDQFHGLHTYAQASRLWSDGTVESLAALMRLLCGESVESPSPVPQIGLWHPVGGHFADLDSYLTWYPHGDGPRIGVIVHRRWVASGNFDHYTAAIAALEARGLVVLAGYADLDATPLFKHFFEPAGVDCLLNLVSFNLVGGHGRPDPVRGAKLVAGLNVPYLCAVPLVLQSLEQWRSSRSGLAPHQAVMQVAMPELEGGIEPWVYAGSDQSESVTAPPELAERLARRVQRWVDLRRTHPAERRVAVTLFSMPPDKGSVGSAAYLDVFRSLHRLMLRLKAEGYSVDVPASVDELRRAVLGADTALPGADSLHVAARVDARRYKDMVPGWERIARCWGPPPGLLDADGPDLLIRGRAFGNLFVGVQPSFGYDGDPMRLLFHPNASPSHAFAAYYAWVQQEWGAHALLHFGTHGTLEFMPGRQTGLGDDDFPVLLLGDLPHLYFYSLNNPSEASIAKRRGGAVIISHLTPPLDQAGLYRTLLTLRDTIRTYQETQSAELLSLVRELAAEADLDQEVPPDLPEYPARLAGYLTELETRLIPVGLHVAGEATDLTATARAASELRGEDPAGPTAGRLLELAATTDELGALTAALDGQFVPPAPGGDPVRNPEVLPAGRNIHALSPWAIPSAAAQRTGARLADALLERMGRVPESVALVLWGSDNIKTQGEAVAQALWLMGAVAEPDSLGRMSKVRLIPPEQLGRPRIDVVLTCSGIFRDLFPSVMELLDRAVTAAATADEPLHVNYVRKRALQLAKELGIPLTAACRRVFAASPGQYGTGVNHVVQESTWQQEGELGLVYIERMANAYGRGEDAARESAVFRAALAGVETTIQHLDSVELGLADIDHYFEHLGGLVAAVKQVSGKQPAAYVIDSATAGSGPRLLTEALRIESRTRLLNPRWYEGMLAHGYQGVHEMAQRLDHLFGWQATAGAVDGWVFTGAARIIQAEQDRLKQLNPRALHRMAGRLLEAHDRGLWEGPAADVDALRSLRDGMESLMEGIA